MSEYIIIGGSANIDAMEKALNEAAVMMIDQTTIDCPVAEPTGTSIDTPGTWVLNRVDDYSSKYFPKPKKGKGSWKSPYKFHK